MTQQSRSGCSAFWRFQHLRPQWRPAAGGMSPASLGKPNSQTLDWLDRSLARSNTVGRARKQKPTGNLKLCFKSLQGPSTTLLLRVNMRGDSLYSSPQAKQWVLVSDSADQTLPSQINKSYYKISHGLKVCISSVDTYPVTCSKCLKCKFVNSL